MRRSNKKYILLFTALLLLSVVALLYKKELLIFLKYLIDWNWPLIVISIGVFSISFLHKIKYGEFNSLNLKTFSDLKEFLSEIVDLVTEPSIFVCSVSIMKGLCLDFFYSDSYFSKFSDAERSFIFIVSFSFLVASLIDIKTKAKEIFFDTASIENMEESEQVEE